MDEKFKAAVADGVTVFCAEKKVCLPQKTRQR